MAGVKSGVRKKELTLRVALKIQEMRRISFAIEKLVVLSTLKNTTYFNMNYVYRKYK